MIIDDFLLEPIKVAQSRELLEIVETRHKRSSLIICFQLSAAGWHESISPVPIADAVLDRLAFNSHTIHIEGKISTRKRAKEIQGRNI